MHHTLAMGFIQSISHLHADSQQLLEGELSALQPLGHRLAFQQLHHQEFADRFLAPDVVKDANVRVLKRRNHPRLALELLAEIGRRTEPPRQNFHRHFTAQAGIPRAIYLPHPARAKRFEYFVRP
jgi:hypothetical protein